MDFHVNKIYTDPDKPCGWQDYILFDFFTMQKQNVTVEAPCRSGKTRLCRRLIDMINMMEQKPEVNILYYSARGKTAEHFAYSMGIEKNFQMDSLSKYSDAYIIKNIPNLNHTVFIPKNQHCLDNILTSAIPFQHYIIDDTQYLSNNTIADLLFANNIHNAPIVFVGEDDKNEDLSHKDLWAYLRNHPDFRCYRIIDPELIGQEENVSSIQNIFEYLEKKHPFKHKPISIPGGFSF